MIPPAALGIDPGQKGALVLISEKDLVVHNFKSVDFAYQAMKELTQAFDIKFTILEKVWFRPKEKDVKTTEILIRSAEMWHTLLHCFSIPHELYSPAAWRSGLVPIFEQGKKKVYPQLAKKLMPDHQAMFTRHDIAEAALMAWRAWNHVMAGWRCE